METLVVNAFGGPGVGKTTACWHIASTLKKKGIIAEYVSEYAKELVYEEKFDMLDDSMKNQTLILCEQDRRLKRLIGKVDVIVTDSPLLLSIIYANDKNKDFEEMVLKEFNKYNNFNLVVLRNTKQEYQQSGRKESLEESIKKDKEIMELLDSNKLLYGTYYQSTLDVVVKNIEKTLNRLKNKSAE